MTPIVRAHADPSIRQVTAVMGTQMGKTGNELNCIGKRIDDDPAPVLYVGPTEKNVSKIIEPQLMQLINESDSLSTKFVGGKTSTQTCKHIAGVTIRLGWAGSPSELASQHVCDVYIDELDRMRDLKIDGSVIELVRARMHTYADNTMMVTSTPTIGSVDTERDDASGLIFWKQADPEDVGSPVWMQWQEGTREHWAVPCPHCQGYFIPRFDCLTWPDGITPHEALTEAALQCPRCEMHIKDKHRDEMNQRGLFVAPGQSIVGGQVVGDLPETQHRSFWVSGLMSWCQTFGQRAKDWLLSSRSKEAGRIQGTINTDFGELYAERGEAPDWGKVADRRGAYRSGHVPSRVQIIVISVDVQQDRLIYVIRGWGYAWESWGIEHGEIRGLTKDRDDACWTQLQAMLDRQFDDLPCKAMVIDSGYNTSTVDAFAKKHKSRVYAIVGRDNPARTHNSTPQETDAKGKPRKSGLRRWTLDHGHYKGWVHDRIEWEDEQKGAWHIASDFDDDYCKQVVNGQKLRLASGKAKWLKTGPDHYLDCEYMQVFGATISRVADLPDIERTAAKTKRTRKPVSIGSKHYSKYD